MTKPDIFHIKGKKRASDWSQGRSLSSSNLSAYVNSSPLLTQNLSGGNRAVQRSLSSGTSTVGSLLSRLHLLDYPHRAADYDLLSVCGTGATAKVYKALCRPLKEIVAVKQVDLELVGQNLETIIQEAQLLSQMRHPNILPMLACFVEEAYLYMVTPYVVGGSVESAMNYAFSKGLEERVIAPIMLSVLHALAYLHRHDVIHRDVKASNILLNHDVVVLGDFGIATKVERTLEATQMDDCVRFGEYLKRKSYVGTPVWMAPEVIDQCCGHGMKADIYAFGITILEMAMGRPPYAGMPFEGMFMSKIHHEPPELPSHHEGRDFSHDMRDVVALCLQTDPDNRPTAAKLLKHRFFKWIKHPKDATEELLAGVPGPIKRLDSLDRRMKEAGKAGFDSSDFIFAGDERVPLGNVRHKDGAQATQQWGANEALSVLHKMLNSKGVNCLAKTVSSASSADGSSPKSTPTSLLSGTPSRKLSFSRSKSFAKGEQWPHLPHAALNCCKGILIASGGRKGFGVSSAWGHGFIITNLGTAESPCWTGPVYMYLSETKFVGLGENSRETLILFRDNKYTDSILNNPTFKLGDISLADAVGMNLKEDEVLAILKDDSSKFNGVSFRHYANSRVWSAKSSLVRINSVANEKLYKKPVDPLRIWQGKEAPPVQFRGLIDVLISAQQGRYEKPQLHKLSDNGSETSAKDMRQGNTRNSSQESLAKMSPGDKEPASSVNDTAYTSDVYQSLEDGEFPAPPRSSFSMDGSPPQAASESALSDGQRQMSGIQSMGGKPFNAIPRATSEPNFAPLVDRDSFPWSTDAGTPPPYDTLADDYYSSFMEEKIAYSASPGTRLVTSPDDMLPRHGSSSKTIAQLGRGHLVQDGASPPGDSFEMPNPFSAAEDVMPYESPARDNLSNGMESLTEGLPSVYEGSRTMRGADAALTPSSSRDVSWRPPKPVKAPVRLGSKSVDLSRPQTPPP